MSTIQPVQMISYRHSVGTCFLPQFACRLSHQFGNAQPCCSFNNGQTVASNFNFAIGCPSTTFPRLLSSSIVGDKSLERPHMHQLEHIQKRLEYTVPLVFQAKLDYTFYRKNVFVDNQITGNRINGLENFIYHIGFINSIANFCYTHIEMRILNILPILEDGTVRLRWRICYLGWIGMLNPRNFNAKYRQKNLKWYDGYSVFYVDGEGLVYKVTIQKTMPDESQKVISMKDRTKEFVQRVLPNPSPSCVDHQQQQFTTAKCATVPQQMMPQQQRESDAEKWQRNETMREKMDKNWRLT